MTLHDTAIGLDEISTRPLLSRPPYMNSMISRKKARSWFMLWICLFLACAGTSWFAYQTLLVPQSSSFVPDWKDAQWIEASDGNAPVAYFRYARSLAFVPSGASLTIVADQTFRVFVNNTFIGANETDFYQGDAFRPYIYDITSALKAGSDPNVIVIRVANLNQKTPMVRANLHFVMGASSSDYGTGATWRGTANSSLVYPHNATDKLPWSNSDFDASAWPRAQKEQNTPSMSYLTVDPQIYEYPLPTQWLSAGVGHQGYFVRQFPLSAPLSHCWLRFAAAGPTNIFINGQLAVSWNGTPAAAAKNIVGSLSALPSGVNSRSRFAVGVYDVAPYLDSGFNTISVYVSAPDVSGLLGHTTAAMSMDILTTDAAGIDRWNTSLHDWYASTDRVDGWEQGNETWATAMAIARPAPYNMFYLLDSNAIVQRSNALANTQSPPLTLVGEIILGSAAFVVGLWLLMSLTLGRRYYGPLRNALAIMSLAYLPALALEGLLVTLAREPAIPDPFPYNTTWLMILLGLVLATYLLLWLHALLQQKMRLPERTMPGFKQNNGSGALKRKQRYQEAFNALPTSMSAATMTRAAHDKSSHISYIKPDKHQLLQWLRLHWMMLPLVLLAMPLIFSTLTYEPLWQDELVSFYVAKNSVAHGFPMMPSGFIYAKAELFHYILGLVMLIFGDQGVVPRVVSAIEFLISIPLLYVIGSYFFGRRVGWLAAAMLAFSPFALIWGSQVRMYEQAQICVLVVFYLFYRAARAPYSKRWPYMAICWLLVMYLSHEETFIVLPGLVLGTLMLSKQKGRLLPAVFYNKHWWFATVLGIAVIAAQLLIVRISHPPVLGTDQSMRPNVQLNEDGLPFYTTLLFFPKPIGGIWFTLDSILATMGCIWAVRSWNLRLKYCALLLTVSIFMMACVFTMEADRYFYPLLPIYLLIAAYIVIKMLKNVWKFVRWHMQPLLASSDQSNYATWRLSQPVRWGALVTAILICASILLAPILPINNYNLGVSRLLGLTYHRHFADYDVSGDYIKEHWQSGDIIISVSPDIEMYYYAGRSDYYFSIDRALFLIEQHQHIVNTSTASIALLDQSDFEAVLAKHPRVWIVSDHNSYETQVLRRFHFPSDFHIVYEGARNVVYLRGS